jgi:hypothetical protein
MEREDRLHTTNYQSTFIEVAEDCPVSVAEPPPDKGEKKTVAAMQFELLARAPYRYTSDDVVFSVHADRASIPDSQQAEAREQFFSKGQACLRSSPLAKRYGWGFHFDEEGRVALVPGGSDEYERLASDPGVHHVKAMRSKRA